jgi:hypothetical protein
MSLAVSVVVVAGLAACGSDSGAESSGASVSSPTQAPATSPSTTPTRTTPSSNGTRIRVRFGNTTMTGHLFDNATANDLASRLPMTLTFRDLNGAEKMGPLPRKLSVDGMPRGDDPVVGDIGYWAPDGNVVFYYGDVGYWDGIVRIGRFDGNMDAVAGQHGDFTVSLQRAD